MVIKKQQMSTCERKFVFIKNDEFMMLNKKNLSLKKSTREQTIMAVLPLAKTRVNYTGTYPIYLSIRRGINFHKQSCDLIFILFSKDH